MLRIDDKQKQVRVIEIGACRGIIKHFEWRPWLNLFFIHIVGQVFE
jgi:hypothetical protein